MVTTHIKELVKKWDKQIKTNYSDLTEKEKNSDRDQVMKYLDHILDFKK